MPIYEYECNACGDRHEFIQKFSDSPKRKCPSCGAQRLRRLVSAAAFHLKGDGWYVTDFRDKDKKKKDKKSNGEDKKSTGDAKSGASDSAKSGESSTPAKSDKGKSSNAD
jgi:putative FmdB family regulatory protein